MSVDRPTHFDCRETFARLEDYLDRELSADDIHCIEEHLAICEACTREYQFENRILCALKAKLRCVKAPEGLLERIRKSIDQIREQ
jgi:anti-sigma factor (TIGR02949 family)